jgi:fibronectin-binding autotransporter adhesin
MLRSRKRRCTTLRRVFLLGAAAGSLAIAPLHAATYTVNSNADSGAGTLRQAVIDANANAGVDTIQIDPALNGGTISIVSSLPPLTENVIIDGPAASTLTVQFVSVSSIFSGGFGIDKQNAGTLIFDGRNSYTGGTTITGGALQGDSFSLTGNIVDNGSVNFFQQIGDGTYAGDISGIGSFVKSGFWKLTMTGTNTYSGGTTVSAGLLEGDTDSLQGNILNNSAVIFNQAAGGTYAGNMSGSGSFTKLGAGTLILSGTNTYTGLTIVSGGTLQGNTASLPGNIVNGGAVIFDQAVNGTYAGNINFNGTVTKTGAGTLTMTGTNSYTGGTTVTQGVLQGDTDSLQGAITNNSAVVFDQAVAGTYTGVMGGTGTLTKLGAGTLTMTGNHTYSGLTTVAAGRLAVNGQIAGAVTVQNGGTLGGTGQVGAVTNDGTIAPGNSIGTITINGNYIHNSGATYEVEVNPAGQSDRIDVTGTATINGGTVSVVAEAGNYASGTTYTILTATGGVTGTFTSVIDNLAFIDPQLVYNANDVQLVLIRNATSFAFVGATPNQSAVAAELDVLTSSAGGDMVTVFDQLESLTALGAQNAFDQMTGEVYASLAAAEMANTTHYLTMVSDRARFFQANPIDYSPPMAQAVSEPSLVQQVAYVQDVPSAYCSADGGCPDCCAIGWDGWIVGYGMSGEIDGNGNATGLDYSFWGTTVGVDRVVDGTLLGAAFGYTPFDADRNEGGDRLEADNYHVSLYGSANLGAAYTLGVVSYGHSDYDATRRIAFGAIDRTATANFDANEFSAYVETGLYRHVGAVVVQPLAGLQYINLERDGFTETGADALNLTVGRNSSNSFRGILGARVARPFMTESCRLIVPEVRARWMHEFLDEEEIISPSFAGVGSGSFAIQGVDAGDDFLILGTGVTAGLSDRVSVFVNYDAQFSENETAHGGNGGVQVVW